MVGVYKAMIEVIYYYDESCDMHKVTINGKVVEEGNYHDFHPEDYIEGIKDLAEAASLNVKFFDKEYSWVDSE